MTIELTKEQKELILFTQRHQQAIVSGILSTFAIQSGAKITEATELKLDDEYNNLTIVDTSAIVKPTK